MQYNVFFPRIKIFPSETIGEARVSSSSWFSTSLLKRLFGGNHRRQALRVEEVDPPVGRQRRGAVFALEPLLPMQPAGLGVEAAGDAVVGDQEQQLAQNDRRGRSGVPSRSCQTMSLRGRLPSPPGLTANSGLRIPCVA